MLRITVEVVPAGDAKPRTLETAEITNIGGDTEMGNYLVEFSDGSTKVIGNHRKRSGVHPLLARVFGARSQRRAKR